MSHPVALVLPDGATLSADLAAELVANLRYDALGAFFDALAERLALDAHADAARGRPQLAERLHQLAQRAAWCARDAESVWRLCAPRSQENP